MKIPKDLQAQVWERDAARCRYCLLSQYGQAARFHVDHVLPRCKGGATAVSNLALVCSHCNLRKADKTSASDPVTQEEVPLFHPLSQAWHEHFVLRPDGTCHGLTPIGRATVQALHMNHEFAQVARFIQIMSGVLSPTEHLRN
jgi:hypothetical protein